MIKISETPTVSGATGTTKQLKIPAADRQRLEEALNEQFPDLVASEKPNTCLFAAQASPKGNVTVWKAVQGIHSVSLTGALTSLNF